MWSVAGPFFRVRRNNLRNMPADEEETILWSNCMAGVFVADGLKINIISAILLQLVVSLYKGERRRTELVIKWCVWELRFGRKMGRGEDFVLWYSVTIEPTNYHLWFMGVMNEPFPTNKRMRFKCAHKLWIIWRIIIIICNFYFVQWKHTNLNYN